MSDNKENGKKIGKKALVESNTTEIETKSVVEATEPVVDADETITDPNLISTLSERFKEVLISGPAGEDEEGLHAEPLKSFEKRIQDQRARFRLARSPEDEKLADGVRAMLASDGLPAGQARVTLNSPAGLKLLLSIETTDHLRGYCELLGVTVAEVDSLLEGMKDPFGSFANLSTVMAVGVWAQNEKEKASRGLTSSQGTLFAAEYAFTRLHGYDTFFEGVAFSKRVWNAVKTEKKRGRRPKSITARYFLSDTEKAEGASAVQEDIEKA